MHWANLGIISRESGKQSRQDQVARFDRNETSQTGGTLKSRI